MSAERITIDVARTRGTRWAHVRLYVAPRPGEPGTSYRVGGILLPADFALDREVAYGLAKSVLESIERQALLYPGPQPVQDQLFT